MNEETQSTEAAQATPAPAAEEVSGATATITAADHIDPQVMEMGQQNYLLCAACHGQQGQGTPGVAPPLAGSDWVTGPEENLILIQLRGLQGPIEVSGMSFNGMMPPMAHQSDEQIASVLTFIRNSWGNVGSAVTSDQVAALRDQAGQPPLTATELVPPSAPGIPSADPQEAQAHLGQEPQSSYNLESDSGMPGWGWALLILWVVLCIVPFLRKPQ